MFSALPKRNFNVSVTFILSSANALKLDQSKILSFGKEIIQKSAYLFTKLTNGLTTEMEKALEHILETRSNAGY